MDGAAQAGEREAHRILKRLARKGVSHVKAPTGPFQEIEPVAAGTVTAPTGIMLLLVTTRTISHSSSN
mgnify:CR=1 FL=1